MLWNFIQNYILKCNRVYFAIGQHPNTLLHYSACSVFQLYVFIESNNVYECLVRLVYLRLVHGIIKVDSLNCFLVFLDNIQRGPNPVLLISHRNENKSLDPIFYENINFKMFHLKTCIKKIEIKINNLMIFSLILHKCKAQSCLYPCG